MRVAAITDVDLETVQFLPLDDGACSITWSDTDGQKHQRSFTNSKDAVDFKADFLT